MKKKFINVDGKKFYITELPYIDQHIYEHSFSTNNYDHEISIQSNNHHAAWVVTVTISQKDSNVMTQHYFNIAHHKKRSQVIREALNRAYEYVSGSIYKDDVEHYKPTPEAKIHYTKPGTLLETIANYVNCYEGKVDVRIHDKEEQRHNGYTFFGLNNAIEHGLIDADDLSGSDWVCSWYGLLEE